MQKYNKGVKRRHKPTRDEETGEVKLNPFVQAQQALQSAAFSRGDREEFFTDAYGDIMVELFEAWLKTEPHCTKEREYLYHVAMALGSVKQRLVNIEMYGHNVQHQMDQDSTEESET